MATPKFNPDLPAGFGYGGETPEGTPVRWLNQGGYMFDPITKELMPGQLPTTVTDEDRARARALPIGQREGADLFQPDPEPAAKRRGRKPKE